MLAFIKEIENFMTTNKTDREITLPTYFISHGGGPWPWLKKEMPIFDQLEASLQELPREIGVTPMKQS